MSWNARILYIGFGELMESMESRLFSRDDVVFSEILQLSSDVQENLLADGDIFLIGPYTLDPVKQVQRAAQQNPLISIVLLIFPDQYQKVKQAVQFSYKIGKHVTFVSYDLGKDITDVFDNAIQRTRQRKSFARITEQQFYPKPATAALTFKNLSLFLDNAPIGAIVFDENRKVVTANLKAKQFLGTKLSDGINVNWSDLFQSDPGPFQTALNFATSDAHHEVLRVNDQFLEINISPLSMEEGNPHYLLLLNDVTEKIRTENKLQRKVDELEFLNQELDQFVNVISHDFKTPLTSIGLLAELGMRETDPEKQTNFLRQIKASSNKLRDLLKGLNVLVDANKTRSEKIETVSFQDRLDIVLTDYQEIISTNNDTVLVDFSRAPDLKYFTAHIDSLLGNLINNAIKYRNPGLPLVIEIKSEVKKEYVILSVKDNGIGIDLSKNLNKLFQPFKRLTDQGTGSGLGLSIIKRVIEKSQGYLEVFSKPGAGTEFKAYLKPQN